MKFLKLAILVITAVTFTAAQTVYYVKTGGNDTDTGTTWGTAFATVQQALSVSVSGDQIWVAAGTYKPSTSDPAVPYTLKSGVALYGGFAGSETALGERDWETNTTILSGDIDNDGTLSGNSYHVLKGIAVTSLVIDGFTITGGNDATSELGGGILLLLCEGTLSNLILTGNYSPANGGGISNAFGSPTLTNIRFEFNGAAGPGGGMYNQNGNPIITNCTFYGNKAANGGGLYNAGGSIPVLTNIIFKNDTAVSFGGGFYNNDNALTMSNILFNGNHSSLGGGGLFELGSSTLINATFYGNTSDNGGGMFFSNFSEANIINSILWNNSATTNGNEIYSSSENNTTISYSLIEGGIAGAFLAGSGVMSDGGNNIESDPMLDVNLELSTGSSAIDAGNNSVVTASTDLNINTRIVNSIVDLGAYESQTPLPVELVSFTAVVGTKGVRLQWKTATEVNNFGFEVERKQIPLNPPLQGGSRIREADEAGGFEKVRFVEGNGTTNSPKSYSFVDATAKGKVAYRLKQIDHDGNFTYSQSVEIEAAAAPSEFSLGQNYPNPFNPTTIIRFELKLTSAVKLEIYNTIGQRVREWNYGMMEAGKYTESIDMSRFASGAYVYRFSALGNDGQTFVSAKKMTLTK